MYAHRYILAARCDVFRVMFADQSSKHKDGDVPLVLSDITQDVFYPLLEYIYTNTVTLSSKVVGTCKVTCVMAKSKAFCLIF